MDIQMPIDRIDRNLIDSNSWTFYRYLVEIQFKDMNFILHVIMNYDYMIQYTKIL